jgi:uncharacterized membrane protein (UPF0182 family)
MTNPTPISQKRLSPARIAIAIVIVAAVILLGVAGVYTDLLWFGQLGFSQVLVTQIVSETALFAIAAIAMGGLTGISLAVAYRHRPIYAKFNNQNDLLSSYRQILEQLRRLVMIGVPTALAIFGGMVATAQWETALAWLNRTQSGTKDAQFGLDVSFYMFDLPFLRAVVTYVSAILLLATLLGALVHLVFGGIRFNGRDSSMTKAARIQISISAALYMVAQAASLWLDQFSTMTSSSGLYTGATYKDVNAVIPGFQILALISFVVGILFLITAIIGRWRLPLVATALMVVSSLVLGGLYPWIVQTFQVVPNERTLEAEFIKRNIDATRKAYGLENVEVIDYQAKTTAEAGALRKDAETTANIRIIDPALVSASFKQLEQFKQYYGFVSHLDVDRYKIDGKTQDTVVAVRELNQSGLGDSQSWYNNVIVYTHGYGVVAAYGNQRSADGQPVFLQKGIPSTGALGEFEPRIYFGENSSPYSIVGAPKGATPRELDYPAGDGETDQAYTTFNGNGGPKLDNIFARLAYALKFQSEQILLSDAITNDSQILYDRSPRDRVAAVAPYLTLDSDSYPAVVDGRVVWIVDGYTTSNSYPYSRSENLSNAISDSSTGNLLGRSSVNYIRNSVKATVDAYDGSVKLYAWDSKDPILKTWSKVFPGTIRPVSEMSADLISHVRYPADLFKVQRAILGSYHVTDPGSFYSQEDAWMTPNDPAADIKSAQPPYYLSMEMPGTTSPEFSIYSTFIPRSTGESSRNVLMGYLAASSDAGNNAGQIAPGYGKLRLLALPKSTTVPGPGQVQNAFNSDSEVSRLLNILRQGSTKVLSGNLLTLPVGGGLLYVQPVYIQSTGETSFPLLKKVLVAFGDQIAFEDTLTGALDSLFGGNAGASAGDGSGVTPPTNGGTSSGNGGTTGSTSNANLKAALERARQALADKQDAMVAGDWAAYGKADKALQAAIEAALAASK